MSASQTLVSICDLLEETDKTRKAYYDACKEDIEKGEGDEEEEEGGRRG